MSTYHRYHRVRRGQRRAAERPPSRPSIENTARSKRQIQGSPEGRRPQIERTQAPSWFCGGDFALMGSWFSLGLAAQCICALFLATWRPYIPTVPTLFFADFLSKFPPLCFRCVGVRFSNFSFRRCFVAHCFGYLVNILKNFKIGGFHELPSIEN